MKILSVLIMISMLPLLSGCFAVAAGAAAGGATGYYVEKEDQKDDRAYSSQQPRTTAQPQQ